tara:strand:+ start:94 stop:411 length:318 start_codon:yes stop_codon:yes gene_type:complete
MSYKWPEKDPDETSDFSVDWSRFLGDDSIVSTVFFIDDENGTKTQLTTALIVNGIQFIQSTVSGNVATARFAQGINNLRYNVTCRINTTQGLTFERSVILPVRNR